MLKTYCLYTGITFCLLFLQSNAWLPLGNHGIRPDLLLFLMLNAAVKLPAVHCACIVFIISYVFEALSGAPVGLFISTYLLIFAAIAFLRRFYNFTTLFELFGLLVVCLVLKYSVLYFFLCFVYEYHYTDMFKTIFGEVCFTIIVFPLFFPILQNVLNRSQAPGVLSEQTPSHGT
jgi:hypothetical protein